MKILNAFQIVLALATPYVANAQSFCSGASHSGTSEKVTSNKVGSINGIGYELWADGGSNSATFYSDGSFSCSFQNSKDYLCRTGLSFDSTQTYQQIGHMFADYKLVKQNIQNVDYSYVGIYGWTRSPLVEWYIVDNWLSQYRPGDWVGNKKHGDFTIDGAQYTVFENDRFGPSIDGDTQFKQFFSIRQQARDCGTIDINAHFEQWEKLGMKLGKMHEAKILGEAGSNGGGTSGTADFPYAKVYIGQGNGGGGGGGGGGSAPATAPEAPASGPVASAGGQTGGFDFSSMGGGQTGGFDFSSMGGGQTGGFDFSSMGGGQTGGFDFGNMGGGNMGGFDFGNMGGGNMGGFDFGNMGGGNMGGFDFGNMGGGNMGGFDFGNMGGGNMGGFDFSSMGGGDMGGFDFGNMGGGDMGGFDFGNMGGGDMGGFDFGNMGGGNSAGGFDFGGGNPAPTAGGSAGGNAGGSCSAKIINLGYPCCKAGCTVEYTDADGDWGIEDEDWCGCGDRITVGQGVCSSKITDQGYSCCKEGCIVYYTDADGDWGAENDEWCGCGGGVKKSPNPASAANNNNNNNNNTPKKAEAIAETKMAVKLTSEGGGGDAGGDAGTAAGAAAKSNYPKGTGFQFYTQCKNPNEWAMTYDDGPTQFADDILDLLKENGIKATFFLLGKMYMEAGTPDWKRIVKRMYDEGHVVASHTFSHQDLTSLSPEQIKEEMQKIEDAIYDAVGVKPAFMRPPYGSGDGNQTVMNALKEFGITAACTWHVDPMDWDNGGDINFAKQAFSKLNGEGVISLNHLQYNGASKQGILDLAKAEIEVMKGKGYKSVTMEECLGMSAYK